MKKIILILIITISLIARGGWSAPVMISDPASIWNQNCQIEIDNNGVLHAIWNECTVVDSLFFNLAVITYSKSTDDGKSWSVPINITPNNTTERNYEPKIAIDSENNVHIIFYYLSDDNAFYYMNNVGGSWSEPEYLGFHITSKPLIEIDQDDRIYLFFYSGGSPDGKSYYIFKDKSGSWNTPSSVLGVQNYSIADILSYGSNLYAVGREYITTKSGSYARVFKYDKTSETWTANADISFGSGSSIGESVFVKDDTIHIAIFDGPNGSDNVSKYIKGGMDLNSWSVPDSTGINMSFDKSIYVNSDNNVHLVEGNPNGIIHTYKIEDSWINDIPHDTTMGHSSTFNDIDTIYLLYHYDKKIYFISKLTSGIEENNYSIIKDFRINHIYPNPFNNETTILFSLKEMANIEMNLYNSNGQLVEIILKKKLNKGSHKYTINANNINSGVFYCKMIVDGVFKDSKKVTYLK